MGRAGTGWCCAGWPHRRPGGLCRSEPWNPSDPSALARDRVAGGTQWWGSGGDIRAPVFRRPWPCRLLRPAWGPGGPPPTAASYSCFSALVSTEGGWPDTGVQRAQRATGVLRGPGPQERLCGSTGAPPLWTGPPTLLGALDSGDPCPECQQVQVPGRWLASSLPQEGTVSGSPAGPHPPCRAVMGAQAKPRVPTAQASACSEQGPQEEDAEACAPSWGVVGRDTRG